MALLESTRAERTVTVMAQTILGTVGSGAHQLGFGFNGSVV